MRQTLETWARRVWVERDGTAIDDMLYSDSTAHGLGLQSLVGVEAFKAFHGAICGLLDETELVIDHSIEADGWLACLCTFRGKTRDGRQASINGAIHARIASGHILEAYNHFDFLGLFVQLGLLPPDTLARCLGGRPACGDGAAT